MATILQRLRSQCSTPSPTAHTLVAESAVTASSAGIFGFATAFQEQVAAVQIPTNCVEQKTVTNSQGTVYDAIWGNVKKLAPRLNVGIWKVANPVYFTILKGAHASGKSAGIGESSRETGPVNGATGASMAFVVGGYFVLIYVDTGPNKHLNGLGAFNAIAKTVAAKL